MRMPSIIKTPLKALDLDYAWYRLQARRRQRAFSSELGIPVISPRSPQRSSLPIDIVIPVIDKDAGTLPLVIDSAREHIAHPIGGVYLVSPKESPIIKAIAAFERTLVSAGSRWDQARAGRITLEAAEQRGEQLFFGPQALCSQCHGGPNLGGAFADATQRVGEPAFYNIGLFNIGGSGATILTHILGT